MSLTYVNLTSTARYIAFIACRHAVPSLPLEGGNLLATAAPSLSSNQAYADDVTTPRNFALLNQEEGKRCPGIDFETAGHGRDMFRSSSVCGLPALLALSKEN